MIDQLYNMDSATEYPESPREQDVKRRFQELRNDTRGSIMDSDIFITDLFFAIERAAPSIENQLHRQGLVEISDHDTYRKGIRTGLSLAAWTYLSEGTPRTKSDSAERSLRYTRRLFERPADEPVVNHEIAMQFYDAATEIELLSDDEALLLESAISKSLGEATGLEYSDAIRVGYGYGRRAFVAPYSARNDRQSYDIHQNRVADQLVAAYEDLRNKLGGDNDVSLKVFNRASEMAADELDHDEVISRLFRQGHNLQLVEGVFEAVNYDLAGKPKRDLFHNIGRQSLMSLYGEFDGFQAGAVPMARRPESLFRDTTSVSAHEVVGKYKTGLYIKLARPWVSFYDHDRLPTTSLPLEQEVLIPLNTPNQHIMYHK